MSTRAQQTGGNVLDSASEYRHADAECNESHSYLVPALVDILSALHAPQKRIFEVGCGNGSVADHLSKLGYSIVGVDPSTNGIEHARRRHPQLDLHLGSAYDPLVDTYGQFPIVLSLEVVEHVYLPRKYAATIYSLLEPGGSAIISTPFHGYWKNLALAVTGKLDAHFTALWDHGHIKFWSIKTLTTLLREAGFRDIHFRRVGRLPWLAKSMITIAKK